MRFRLWLVAVIALVAGMFLLAKTGDTMWASERSGYPAMIYLCGLFLLFPAISLIITHKRR